MTNAEIDAASVKPDAVPVGTSEPVRRFIDGRLHPTAVMARLWTWRGIRLMTHEATDRCIFGVWKVSEETTGIGVPNSQGDTLEKAAANAVAFLTRRFDELPAEMAKYPVLNPPNAEISNSGHKETP